MVNAPAEESSWRQDLLDLIRSTWDSDQLFSLTDLYSRSQPLIVRHAGNLHPEAKIRQVLQVL